jgi:hypothetical protein
MLSNIQPYKEIKIINDKMSIISTRAIGAEWRFNNETNWYQSATIAKDIHSFCSLHIVINDNRDTLQENLAAVEQSILLARYCRSLNRLPTFLHTCDYANLKTGALFRALHDTEYIYYAK